MRIRHLKWTQNENNWAAVILIPSVSGIQWKTSCFWRPLLPSFQVAKEFGFSSNGFSIYLNRNKTGEILSQNKTLSLLKIKYVCSCERLGLLCRARVGLCLDKSMALCESKRDRVVFLCLLGMATCYFFSHPQRDPPVRTWTQLSLTLLLPTPPSLPPPPHHLPYPAHTLHHRSQRMRLTSICPSRRERSTETETPSCELAFLSTLPQKVLIYIACIVLKS